MANGGNVAVFISYAWSDGAKLAGRLCADLRQAGFDPWLDTVRLAGGASWTAEIEREIDARPVLLALMTPGSFRSDICRAEQLRALRNQKQVIPLLVQKGTDIPLHLEAKNYRDFSTPERYAVAFRSLVADIRAERGGVRLKDQFRETYVTAPPLPLNFVERRAELAALRDRLLREAGGPSIALSACRGMGGIGKTVLAQALARDPVIQAAFPDGIAWVTVGREPAYDLKTRLGEVRRALWDEGDGEETELQCINRYRTALRDKAALVIVDDVWRTRDIEPFLAESDRSRILFTTRDSSIAAALGADEHLADLLTPAQSRQVLARWAGLMVEELPAEAEDLVQECGRLPLALAMIGAMLRGKPPGYWRYVRDLLRDADLSKIKAAFPNYPYTDLFRALQVSVEALEPELRGRYRALAVMLEDMPIAPAIQQTLWNTPEPLVTAERLIELSLAQREGDAGAIRLHDLQLDYVRAQFPERPALELIHGALRLSAHVVRKDPRQFASQLVGRLLPHKGVPEVQRFLDSVAEAAPRPWIRPLFPALSPPGTALVRTLEGHSDRVNGVALSGDGRRVVSASADGTLKVWDLATGAEILTFSGHSDEVNGVALSGDGRWAVSASDDGTVLVWDLVTGEKIHSLAGHSGPVNWVALSSDGERVVSASADLTLNVWDLKTAKLIRTLEDHSDSVLCVALSANDRWVASAFEDRTLIVWDLATGEKIRTLECQFGEVYCNALSPDCRRAVSASQDGALFVWDLASGGKIRTLKDHFGEVCCVALSQDGRRAVSASQDGTLFVWDLASGEKIRTLKDHFGEVCCVALSQDGRRAVSASQDGTLKVWDLSTGGAIPTIKAHSGAVKGVALSGDGRRAGSASDDQKLIVWDLATGEALRTLEGHSGRVLGVALSADGGRAVSASDDATLKVWDLATGTATHTLVGHSSWVFSVALSGDGNCVVSASLDKTLRVWDLMAGEETRTLFGHSGGVFCVALCADARRAVSASSDKTLKVWDLASGKLIRTLAGHSGGVFGVALSPNSQLAISASSDKTLKLWDLETGVQLRTLVGHSDPIKAVVSSSDGRLAISASYDKTLKVWDLSTGLPIATFFCDAWVNCCSFAPPNLIVAGDATGRVHFLAMEE